MKTTFLNEYFYLILQINKKIEENGGNEILFKQLEDAEEELESALEKMLDTEYNTESESESVDHDDTDSDREHVSSSDGDQAIDNYNNNEASILSGSKRPRNSIENKVDIY